MKSTKKTNTGLIKLTKNNVSGGVLRKKIQSMQKHAFVLNDKELKNLRRKIIPDKGIGKNIYIFAYGSLLWNPTFNYINQYHATIFGYHRKFCMKTKLGRGNAKNPGLMLGLDAGGSCKGIVYKLERKNQIKEIDLLFKREMITGAYIPKLLKTTLLSGEKVTSLSFTVDKNNKNYISNISLKQIANFIYHAHGFLGSCQEYLNFTISSLEELGIKDIKMKKISSLIKEMKF